LSLRPSTLPRHGRRALVASGMTAALVLVPVGMAQAAPEVPDNPVSDAVDEVVDQLPTDELPTEELPTEELPTEGLPTEELPTEELPIGGGAGDPGPAEEEGADPLAELTALFEELGLPPECIPGFQSVIEGIVAGLPTSPEELEEAVNGLVAGLEAAFENQDPAEIDAALEELLGADVLAQLEEALTACLPVEEEPEEELPVAPVGGGTPQAPAPAPHVQQPVAAPVSYPGYAPTGADTARADDVSVPLTALGGGLVLVAAGAAGYGMRGRAVRTRD
jgi:hypothetical protein